MSKKKYGLEELNKMVDRANENGGSLCLSGLTSIPEGFNPTVGGSLYLSGLTSIPEGFNPTVGGWLDLSGLTSIPEGFNPTVGGSLYLSGLTSIPEGFNPTVGGWLDLSGLTSIPEGFNPTVGGSLDLSGLTAKYTQLENGIYVPEKYLYADDTLTHVKRTKKIGAYTLYVGKIPGHNVLFDGVNYAHCKTIEEGINDLAFKSAADRGAEQYRGIDRDKPMTLPEATVMYRIITGACSQGTQRFIDSLGDALKESYTVNEIISLTANQYGGDAFRRFFEED